MGNAYHVQRRDALEDHGHSLPDGRETSGSLAKPSTSHRAGWHTHLYQHDGKTLETCPAFDGPGHEHTTEIGESSGPHPLKKSSGEMMPRTDSLRREGMDWVLRGPNGHALARSFNLYQAFARYDSADGDEEAYKAQVRDFSEPLWEKAKRASEQALGKVRWPFVSYWYQQQGGSLK